MSMEHGHNPEKSLPAGLSGGGATRDPCQQAGGMTCKDCVDFLLDYIDGVMPPSQVATFHRHLEICPNCTVYLENYRKAAQLTGNISRQERHAAGVGQPAPAALIEAILKARKQGA